MITAAAQAWRLPRRATAVGAVVCLPAGGRGLLVVGDFQGNHFERDAYALFRRDADFAGRVQRGFDPVPGKDFAAGGVVGARVPVVGDGSPGGPVQPSCGAARLLAQGRDLLTPAGVVGAKPLGVVGGVVQSGAPVVARSGAVRLPRGDLRGMARTRVEHGFHDLIGPYSARNRAVTMASTLGICVHGAGLQCCEARMPRTRAVHRHAICGRGSLNTSHLFAVDLTALIKLQDADRSIRACC
ncbi:hypothetical protein LO772_05030 [Yinghuangia sp. ASG 101]|uniref:hypothetical protein n=1 Tax=Yinghuangia sp. ASG 101 TaxID=2896848 RepID=UPI001E2AAEBE|nr:hypothetical protein [Yinghuangia sp. ASG 101]UGQ12989.1 hypothetical protein LO772_05030 [Yinghuangia sp. ASG 101]